MKSIRKLKFYEKQEEHRRMRSSQRKRGIFGSKKFGMNFGNSPSNGLNEQGSKTTLDVAESEENSFCDDDKTKAR